MTPDEHYIRAEELAAQAAGTFQMILDAGAQKPIDADIRSAWFGEMGVLARLAQVHATLATRSAAPAMPAPSPYAAPYPDPNYPAAPPPQGSWAPPNPPNAYGPAA
jgi:hypothetical protein